MGKGWGRLEWLDFISPGSCRKRERDAPRRSPCLDQGVGSGSRSVLICLVELQAWESKLVLGLEPGLWCSVLPETR